MLGPDRNKVSGLCLVPSHLVKEIWDAVARTQPCTERGLGLGALEAAC